MKPVFLLYSLYLFKSATAAVEASTKVAPTDIDVTHTQTHTQLYKYFKVD